MEMNLLILRDDSGRKVRQCPMCPYSSHQKGRLRDHMLTHTGERPHPCPYCGRRFTQKSTMRRHAITHVSPLGEL
ncbi:hypothetical protein TNCV_4426691 [Trichonephila clavipes]|uniref:C2H2-type domain-containing protein n=1 Tax=Trichonephila inaurata madagascariensis TaxID=2747483 RepID=A0A8X6XMM0_9ARAC|nr:hypothetical protein TNCV_4426691 [Trichonephila clavipes]GFY56767.1 hypothetical protein TNIN_404751 [Trichonephila inaurata madagascariensis]